MSVEKQNRPYLVSVKDWKIRNMIEGYLRARLLFKSRRNALRSHQLPSFQTLREICDILYHIKEDHHMIFRRGEEEKSNGNGNHKFVPGMVEMAFIDNVGLLFHKVLVARELRYILEHYAKDDELWESHFASLKDNLQKIEQLFDKGVAHVLDLIRANAENVLLTIFLLENQAWVGKCLSLRKPQSPLPLANGNDWEPVYMKAADYYVQSGWYEKAREALKKVLKKNSRNAVARQTLAQIEGK
jgi:tetratricopeptide (TPR) repeat protein